MRFYRKTAVQGMIEWDESLPMALVSISEADRINGSPKKGDMIAVNEKDSTDMWLIAEKFFKDNYVEAIDD